MSTPTHETCREQRLMGYKFKGIRALGNMSPEDRSNMLGISRALKSIAPMQRRISNEETVVRRAGVTQQRGYSAGGRSCSLTFGLSVDKPIANDLLLSGVGAAAYIAVDTRILYIWDGTSWGSGIAV